MKNLTILLVLLYFKQIFSAISLTSSILPNGSNINSDYWSTLYKNGSLNSAGTIIPLQLNPDPSTMTQNYFNIFCSFGTDQYLWGSQNIKYSNSSKITLSNELGFLNSTFKQPFSIQENAYLGPNYDMIKTPDQTTFTIFLYTSSSITATQEISNLAAGYSSAAEKDDLTFTFKGFQIDLTPKNFTTGGALNPLYQSILNLDGSLSNGGTAPTLQLQNSPINSSDQNSFYNIYCTDGINNLWGNVNIASGSNPQTFPDTTGNYVVSDYSSNYSIPNTSIEYLGPNNYMIPPTNINQTYTIYLFWSPKQIEPASLSDLASQYSNAPAYYSASVQFVYQGFQISISSSSFVNGGSLGSDFGSVLNQNGTINSSGLLPTIQMLGAPTNSSSQVSFYNIYCYNGQNLLWGKLNIVGGENATLTNTPTWLTSSFATTYDIDQPNYLGPNVDMLVKGKNNIFTINLFWGGVQATTISTLTGLNNAFSKAGPTNSATLTFIYPYPLSITSSSYTPGSYLDPAYASILYANGTLDKTGVLPNIVMSGGLIASSSAQSYFNIFCALNAGTYLWGTQNINVTSDSLTLLTNYGQWLDSTFKTKYGIKVNSYLGPNSVMTGSENRTFVVYMYNDYQAGSSNNTIQDLFNRYEILKNNASTSSQAYSITFQYAKSYKLLVLIAFAMIWI